MENKMTHILSSVHGQRMDHVLIRRALISVSDKTGIVELATILSQKNVEILSTGGTAKTLREAGIVVKDVGEFTGFPEILDGRVKTLHPKIHGALLYVRGNEKHEHQIMDNEINGIDLVVMNLYPFEATGKYLRCSSQFFDFFVFLMSTISIFQSSRVMTLQPV